MAPAASLPRSTLQLITLIGLLAGHTMARAQDPGGTGPDPDVSLGGVESGRARTPLSITSLSRWLGLGRIPFDDAEKQALGRMIQVFPLLAGGDGRFTNGDLDPILQSLQGDVSQRVTDEIWRRAGERISMGQPGWFWRLLTTLGGLALRWNEFKAQGMQEGNSRVLGGLREFLVGAGTTASTPDPQRSRALRLSQLEQFGSDARLVNARIKSQGSSFVSVTFPSGMAVDDLVALRDGQVPPNAQVRILSRASFNR